MSAPLLPFAIAAACALLWSLPLRAQEPAAAAPPAASPMFTERARRKAAFNNGPVQNAVRLGNGWLVGHQDENGGWDCEGFTKHDPQGKKSDGPGNAVNDVGVSALALLALLAQADPAHLDATRRAADFLVRTQDGPSGQFPAEAQGFIYHQALATLALTEAAALLGELRYREAATKGLQYLERHRNPGAAWRYRPQDGQNDTSATSWCVAAYAAATHAGIEVPAEGVAEALAWLEGVTDPADGAIGYTLRGEGAARPIGLADRFPANLTEATTAAGMHMRAIAGLPPTGRLHVDAVALLLNKPPTWVKPAIDIYYWFHGSEAMAAHPDKAAAQKWSAALHKTLLPVQRKDGAFLGSWDVVDAWSEEGGRVYATAIAVLALSSAWRLGAIEAIAQVPDVPPFRRVYSLWKAGKLGAATGAVAEARAGATTSDQQEQARRIAWFATVQTKLVELVVARIKSLHPETLDRHARLAELAAALPDTTAGKAAAEAMQAMLADPASRDEIESTKLLRAIFASFDANNPPKESSKRRALFDRFEKVATKYPRTPAAAKALQWLSYLR